MIYPLIIIHVLSFLILIIMTINRDLGLALSTVFVAVMIKMIFFPFSMTEYKNGDQSTEQ